MGRGSETQQRRDLFRSWYQAVDGQARLTPTSVKFNDLCDEVECPFVAKLSPIATALSPSGAIDAIDG